MIHAVTCYSATEDHGETAFSITVCELHLRQTFISHCKNAGGIVMLSFLAVQCLDCAERLDLL